MMKSDVYALILLLARKSPTGAVIKKAQELVDKGMDWKKFLEDAVAQGVAPLIYKNIGVISEVPHDVTETFRKSHIRNISDTVRSSYELAEIIGSLKKADIEAIPIKGVTNAEEVFGESSLYPSSDIDIMIRQKDVFKATDIMKDMGYSSKAELDGFFFEKYIEVNFFKTGAKHVELHFSMHKKRYFNIPEDFWWEDLRELDFNGNRYKMLSREKTILFASIHLFSHGYSPFKFIVSISEMLRSLQDDIDWNKLIEDAKKLNIYQPLLLSLYLAVTFLDAPLPDDISGLFKKLSFKERWIFKQIQRNVFNRNVRFAKVVFLLTVMQYNSFEVICRMIKWIFPPLKEISIRYNISVESKKIYLYYILNPFLLLKKKRA